VVKIADVVKTADVDAIVKSNKSVPLSRLISLGSGARLQYASNFCLSFVINSIGRNLYLIDPTKRVGWNDEFVTAMIQPQLF
jgi:hypothetical protein